MNRFLRLILSFIFCALSGRLWADIPAPSCGLTIITHGFQLDGDFPAWLDYMADEISARQGHCPIRKAQYFRESNTVTLSGVDNLDTSSSGGCVVILDWAEASNNLTIETQKVADAFFEFLFGNASHWVSARNPAEVPIHLIGHSRGASLMSRLAMRFANAGIVVDQVTTLDPHPIDGIFEGGDNDDYPVQSYQNILFLDNYYRTGEGLDGASVANAWNLNFGTALDSWGTAHSLVHTFYYGTINTDFYYEQLTYIPDDWYPGDNTIPSGWYPSVQETLRRNTTGYNYSRFGTGFRPSSGISNSIGGSAGRTQVPHTDTMQWPNVMFRQHPMEYSFYPTGSTLAIPYWQVNRLYDQRITFFLDNDTNPYNGRGRELGSVDCPKSEIGAIGSASFSFRSKTEDVGTHYVGAYAKNINAQENYRVRYDYLMSPITITSNSVLDVWPLEAFTASISSGGTIEPAEHNWHLMNLDASPIVWAASANAQWVSLSSTGETLASGANITLTATISPSANALAAGTHTTKIKISGPGQPIEIPVTLTVFAKPPVPSGFSEIPSASFCMARTEVPWSEWRTVRDWAVANGYSDLSGIGAGKADDHPVQTVSWHEVVKWCNAKTEYENATKGTNLSACYTVGGSVYRTGNSVPDCNWNASGYRLPTSSEWAFAARGGLTGKRFPWGDVISHDYANYYNSDYDYETPHNIGHHPDFAVGGTPYTAPVTSFPPNDYDLYNMAGNVWEWCWDAASTPSKRILRGGGWGAKANVCSLSVTMMADPTYKNNMDLGFRIVKKATLDAEITTPVASTPGAGTAPGTTLSSMTPSCSWSAVPGSAAYGLVITDTAGGNVVYSADAITGTTATVPSGRLSSGRSYAWKVRARDSTGWSDYSSPLYFQTSLIALPRPVPQLNFELSSTDLTSTSAVVRWSWAGNLANTTGILIGARRLNPDGSDGPLIVNSEPLGAASTSFKLNNLVPATRYRINILYNPQAGYAPGSEAFEFITRFPAPTPASPASGATVAKPAMLTWDEFPDWPVGSRIQIAVTSSGFSARTGWLTPLAEEITTGTNFSWSGGVDGQTYWWSVRQASSTGTGAGTSYYSTPRSFVYQTPDSPLAAPVFVTSSADISHDATIVKWRFDDNPAHATHVVVSVVKFPEGDLVAGPVDLASTTTSFAVNGLEPSTQYRAHVTYKPQSGFTESSASSNWQTKSNLAPSISSLATPVQLADGRVRVDFTVYDPESDPMTCRVSLSRSGSSIALINSDIDKGSVADGPNIVYFTAAELAGIPGFAGGLYQVRLRVSDPVNTFSGTAAQAWSSAFAYSVPNDAPSFVGGSLVAVATEDSPFSGQLAATDPDTGDSLAFYKTSGPDWLLVSPTGELHGTPSNENVGVNTFGVRVSDAAGDSASATLTITVANANDAPNFVDSPISVPAATEDTAYAYSLAGTAVDPDAGDSVTYTKTSGPTWLVVSPDGTVSGTPSNSDVGQNTFGLRATDSNGLHCGGFFTVMVANVNDPPVFIPASLSLSANVGTQLAFAVTATDVDVGDAVSYAKLSGPTWLSATPDGNLTGTPASGDLGQNVFVIRANDSQGLSCELLLLVQVIDGFIWTNPSGGSWPVAENWLAALIADGLGSPADFSTVDLTSDVAITLDGLRTISGLKFGDSIPSHNWALNTGSAGPLTLAVASGTPQIEVLNQTATISAVLTGTQGLQKSGAGVLQLGTANTYTGRTLITGGILSINADDRLGAVPAGFGADQISIDGGTLKFTAGFALNANRGIIIGSNGATLDNSSFAAATTIASKISGVGPLTIRANGNTSDSGGSNSGKFSLSDASNDFAGDITVASGLVAYADDGSFGDPANNIILNNNAGIVADANGVAEIRHPIQLAAGTTGTTFLRAYGASTMQVVDPVTGTGSIRKTDGGTVILQGANSFAGNLSVGKGILALAGASNYTGYTFATVGTLSLDADNVLPDSTGVVLWGNSTFHLNGKSETVAAVTVGGTGDTGCIVNLGPTGSTGVLKVTGTTVAAAPGTSVPTNIGGSFYGKITGTGDIIYSHSTSDTAQWDWYNTANDFSGGITITRGRLRTAPGSDGSGCFGNAANDLIFDGEPVASLGNGQGKASLQATASGPLNLAATRDLILKPGKEGTLYVWSGNTYTVEGKITGGGTLRKEDGGILLLNNPENNWSGETKIVAGEIRIGTVGSYSSLSAANSLLTVGGFNGTAPILNLNGTNLTVSGISGGGYSNGEITGANSTLTVTGSGDQTYSGRITNRYGGTNNGGIVRYAGTGSLTLAGTADNSGGRATVDSGTLVLAKTSAASVHAVGSINTAALTINGGEARIGGSGGDQIYTESIVRLTGGILDLNGFYEGFRGLTGTGGVVKNNGASPCALTVGETSTSSDTYSFAGSITDGVSRIGLTKTGAGTLELSGISTYTGNTTVSAGTLRLTQNGRITFQVSDSANNTLTGSGTVVLDGEFAIDISAVSLRSGTWQLESVSSLAGPYGNSFKVVSPDGIAWSDIGANQWTATQGSRVFTFDETTGTLSVGVLGYDTWATDRGLTAANNSKTQDPDHDGRNNLFEFAFDGDPLSAANDGKFVSAIADPDAAGPETAALTLTLPVRDGATFSGPGDLVSAAVDGLVYQIQGSDDLLDFASMNVSEVTPALATGLPALSPGWAYRTFRTPGPIDESDAQEFIRAGIEEAP